MHWRGVEWGSGEGRGSGQVALRRRGCSRREDDEERFGYLATTKVALLHCDVCHVGWRSLQISAINEWEALARSRDGTCVRLLTQHGDRERASRFDQFL